MLVRGEAKLWLYFDFRLGLEVDAFMGIRSCRCCRETEIWRAMETSAAVFRRCSCSSVSVLLVSCRDFSVEDFLDVDSGAGLDTDADGVNDLDMELSEDLAEASESFRRGWAVVVDDVVALRERSLGGGAWIFTVLRLEAAKGATDVVDMLDAEVEAEWSELELPDPEIEDPAT